MNCGLAKNVYVNQAYLSDNETSLSTKDPVMHGMNILRYRSWDSATYRFNRKFSAAARSFDHFDSHQKKKVFNRFTSHPDESYDHTQMYHLKCISKSRIEMYGHIFEIQCNSFTEDACIHTYYEYIDFVFIKMKCMYVCLYVCMLYIHTLD